MPYSIKDRLDTLGERMQELSQEDITYRRKADTLTIENVTLGKIDVNELVAYGIIHLTEKALDFIFDSDELASLNPTTPLDGDEITYNSHKYQVMSIGNETYNYVTTSRKRIRVHTKQIG